MAMYSGFTHWKWWFSSSLCKRLPEGNLMGTPMDTFTLVKLNYGISWLNDHCFNMGMGQKLFLHIITVPDLGEESFINIH